MSEKKQKLDPAETTYRLEFQDHNDPRIINFFDPEHSKQHVFRWSEPVAMVRLDVPAECYVVTIETAALRGSNCDFDFELLWNDKRIRRNSMSIEGGRIRFIVDRSMFVANDEQRLTISSKPLKAENGRRELGMPVKWVELSRAEPGTLLSSAGKRKLKEFSKSIKKIVGRSAPKATLPIWEMKLPSLPTLVSTAEAAIAAKSDYPRVDTVVVSSVEINSRHGTGLLIQYLIEDFSEVATINSRRCYNGDRVRSGVHHQLPNSGEIPRHEIYNEVMKWFSHYPPKQAYIVPYFSSDLLVAIALKDLFNTKICMHIMDDNNLVSNEIPADLMTEALDKSDLRLAISPEMKTAYEERYGVKCWLLPPIVPNDLIWDEKSSETFGTLHVPTTTRKKKTKWYKKLSYKLFKGKKRVASKAEPEEPRGILIGNIWDQQWLDLLRTTVRESGVEVDWYCNNPDAVWLETSAKDLSKDGIHLHDALWGDELVTEMRRRPYAVMPSGRLDVDEKKGNIAKLSLPSRIPFMVASSQLPVVVLGSPEAAASKFIQRFELGTIIDYDGKAFAAAVKDITSDETQKRTRENARRVGQVFGATGLNEWLWNGVNAGQPADNRFEDLFALQNGEFAYFIDTPAPKNLHWEKEGVWNMLKRLQFQGLQPDLIIDVGASTGVWSSTASKVFPDARYVLVDPLMSRYGAEEREYYQKTLENFDLVEAAMSNEDGRMEIIVSDDLYGSSLLKVNSSIRQSTTADVEVVTLDSLAKRLSLKGRTLLKIDVQFAEHLVLAGGRKFIQKHVDTLILELTLLREHPDAKTYREMLDLMDELGYELVDEAEGWRCPKTGRLEQKDSVFRRKAVISQAKAA